MGTGISDMIERCRAAGLQEPEFRITDGFVAVIRRKPERAFIAVGGEIGGEVTPEVRLLKAIKGEMTRQDIQKALGLNKPRNSKQKYRLTKKGRQFLNSVKELTLSWWRVDQIIYLPFQREEEVVWLCSGSGVDDLQFLAWFPVTGISHRFGNNNLSLA